MAKPRLSGPQLHALRTIANAGGSMVETNNWASANSLIRKGLVSKHPTAEPLTHPPTEQAGWAYRLLRLPRARFTLTEEGRDVAATHFKENPMGRKRKAVFEEEDDVLAQMSLALNVDVDDLSIEPDTGLENFGVSPVWRVEEGKREYVVVEDDDAAEELALAIVKQDLEQEPQLFNQNFIESHIDTERLRRELYSDVNDSVLEEMTDLADRYRDDFWRTAEDYIEVPEEDEEGELRDPTSIEVEEVAEKITDERLKDPMAYLEDIYGSEDAVKQAIEIAGIDIDAAAQEAVRDDGFAHFLSTYDGNTYETPDGFVYWRQN